MTGLRGIAGERSITERVAAGRPVLGVFVRHADFCSPAVSIRLGKPGLRAVGLRRDPAGCAGDPAHGRERVGGCPGSGAVRGPGRDARFYFWTSYFRPSGGKANPHALLRGPRMGVPFLASCRGRGRPAGRHPISIRNKSGDAGAAVLEQLG